MLSLLHKKTRDKLVGAPPNGARGWQEHWLSSGFANTDLDLQLKKHGVRKLIVIGMRVNTCIESTVRFAAELGYEVTVVKDAVGGFSHAEHEASLKFNMSAYASAIVSTEEIIGELSA